MKRVMALFLLMAGVLFSGCSSGTSQLLNDLESRAADGELAFGWYGSITGIDASKTATDLNLEVEISQYYLMLLEGVKNDDVTMFFFASIYDNADLVSLFRSVTDDGGSINVLFYNGAGDDYGRTTFKHSILNAEAKKYLSKNYTETQILENKIKAECVISNSVCPAQIDWITNMVGISYSNKEVVYSYELTSKGFGDNQSQQLETQIKFAYPLLCRGNVCFGHFVDAIISIGGVIRYTYSGPYLDRPIDIRLTSEDLKKLL